MSYRCANAFIFADRVYPGGFQVEDGDPILMSHSQFFVKVDVPPAARTEVAAAAPGDARGKFSPVDSKSAGKGPAKKVADVTSLEGSI